MLDDSEPRRQATDPALSFIVQAPAGSGKTEILTQRYLRLLATVSAPEQIVALTFTRKAANEMRERILLALQKTASGVQATSAHQQQTYQYATNALSRDQALNWQLLQNPGRLRIFTIDSLCQRLTQAIPLAEKQIPYAQISDTPQQHYLTAARACLDYVLSKEVYHPVLKTLLLHVDNRQDHLLILLSDMLAKREQWLGPLHDARLQDKQLFEQALASIEQHELARFYQSVPTDCKQDLSTLARQLACVENNPASPRYALQSWHVFEQLNRQLVTSLAALILTSQQTLRKSFDHHVGLKRGTCDDQTYDLLKAASKDLLAKLEHAPDFLEALIQVKQLPAPHYDQKQWQVLQALFTLLPILAAHLHLVFKEHNEVDFNEISQQAIQALGNDEQPTDLALYLDNQIHHLLIDEFQDTSIQQFELITRLLQGWQPNDGKTLFVVGDPMQSIYRFRAAEVGLFLRAKQRGIGPVTLNSLELTSNFRSTAAIVGWVNQQFKTIFPQHDDIESGAVSFHSSIETKTADHQSFVKAYQYADQAQEAQALVDMVIAELQQNPDDNIAILVRSRRQLVEIMRVLKTNDVPCQGVDIDLLANLPHLRDIWTLTQALLMPGNRLTWLSLLRSPWCGLCLTDLHAIANFEKNKSIYSALSQLDKMSGLSPDGLLRAGFVYKILDQALANRNQYSLADWIANTLQKLHSDSVLDSSQQDDLEQFWLLIEKFEQHGQLPDLQLVEQEFSKLYSQKVTPSRLQIMTIHKSKGLEFDCVFLPGLGSKSARMDTPLLRWLKLPTQHGELLLVSPVKAAEDDHCLLYNYLGQLDAQKNSYEQQRLLYVAVTRAKKRVYLFDNRDKISQSTMRDLLKNQEFMVTATPLSSENPASTMNFPLLSRLPTHFYTQPYQQPEELLPDYDVAALTIHDHIPRLIGIVTHELLQWICDHHPAQLEDVPWELAVHHLRSLGFIGSPLREAKDHIKNQIQQLFKDPVGLWLIKAHNHERNECEFLVNEQGEMATRIIDRTFCDQGIRWVIDFKTGREDEHTLNQHRQQVNHYAHFLSLQHREPISCGLYYLENNSWIHWDYLTSIADTVTQF